jgi:hypothetical protein
MWPDASSQQLLINASLILKSLAISTVQQPGLLDARWPRWSD